MRPLRGLALLLALSVPASVKAEAPIVHLPAEARAALAALGEGVVGEALPALPIAEPARLRHLAEGTWTYRLVAGPSRGQIQEVRVEPLSDDAEGATWQVETGDEQIARLRVTTDHRIEKVSQDDLDSNRIVVYRPGLILETGMAAGESQSARPALTTYKSGRRDRVEYEGKLEYTIRYVGRYRVTTEAGTYAARLLEHSYEMSIGPATATYHSWGFYADDVGNVAEVSEETVSALLVYRRSSRSARVLISAPAL